MKVRYPTLKRPSTMRHRPAHFAPKPPLSMHLKLVCAGDPGRKWLTRLTPVKIRRQPRGRPDQTERFDQRTAGGRRSLSGSGGGRPPCFLLRLAALASSKTESRQRGTQDDKRRRFRNRCRWCPRISSDHIEMRNSGNLTARIKKRDRK